MAMYIWLKKSAEKSFTKTDKKREGNEIYTLDGVEVSTHDASGQKFVVIYADPFDPAATMPHIASKHIKRVTCIDRKYFEGFRTDGIYKLKGATAKVETIEKHHSAYNPNDIGHTERYQTISVAAESIKALREIFTQVRQGKLKPAEDWRAPQGAKWEEAGDGTPVRVA